MGTWKWKKALQVAGAVAAVGVMAFTVSLPRIAKWNEERDRQAEEDSSQWVQAQIKFVEGKREFAERVRTELEEKKWMNSTAAEEFERAEGCKRGGKLGIKGEPLIDGKLAAIK